MFEKLQNLHEKYLILQERMASSEVLSDVNKIRTVSKELKELETIEVVYIKFKKILDETADAKELIEIEDDSDMKEMLEERS